MKRLKHNWNSIRQWKGWRRPTTVQIIGILLGLFGVVFGIWAYLTAHGDTFDLKVFAADYGANCSTSLISFTIAVLLIDFLNARRSARERKQAIIQQMGSPVNDAALEAVRIARIEDWIRDGALKGVYLSRANLQGASLIAANLQEVYLGGANLQEADLTNANLQGGDLGYTHLEGATLVEANLQGASLRRANLEGADARLAKLQGARLISANLEGVDLTTTLFSENTILPDEARWQPDTDLARFTDPNHSNFWRSDDPDSPAYRGEESQYRGFAGSEKNLLKPRKRGGAAGKFELKISKNGQFMFILKAANGQTILTSELYPSKAGAKKGIELVRRNATDDSNYERKTSPSKALYFVLKAANGQIIGTGEMYASTSARENGISAVKANAPGAVAEDLAT